MARYLDGVGKVLAREECQHGWGGWRASVDGGLAWEAWVGWAVCLCGWHASVGGMIFIHAIHGWHVIVIIVIIEILFWRAKCWMSTFETKMKNIPNKFEQWFKRTTWLEGQVFGFSLFGPVMQGPWICLNILKYAQCAQIFLDTCNQECNFVNMPEYAWNITYLNKSKF